jgi:hypothetical protein
MNTVVTKALIGTSHCPLFCRLQLETGKDPLHGLILIALLNEYALLIKKKERRYLHVVEKSMDT